MLKRLAPMLTMLLMAPGLGFADEGTATPWQLGFQQAASPVAEKLFHLHDILLVIISIITVVVMAGLVWICIRYNAKSNPVAAKWSHNTTVEVVWTVIPSLIILGLGIYSYKVHNFVETVPDDAMTLKVVGYQWYWHYEYPDQGGINFDSYMIKEADLKPGQKRLLEVDNRLVIPVNTNVRVQVTGADVIHSFAVPAFGMKRDGIPGRLNETWFRAEREGVYYGQCSELCGVGHGFMPVVVEVVSKERFAQWVEEKKKSASLEAPAANVKVIADNRGGI